MDYEEIRHNVMSNFREDYPIILNLLGRISISTTLKVESEEVLSVVKALSLACVEYERYVESNEVDKSELH